MGGGTGSASEVTILWIPEAQTGARVLSQVAPQRILSGLGQGAVEGNGLITRAAAVAREQTCFKSTHRSHIQIPMMKNITGLETRPEAAAEVQPVMDTLHMETWEYPEGKARGARFDSALPSPWQ